MIGKIIKLIDVKSIVTLTLTAAFVKMSVNGLISPEQFQTVFTTVIAFYFGVQFNKKSSVNQQKFNKEK